MGSMSKMASPDRVPPAPPLAGQAAAAASSSLYNLTLDDLAEDNAEGKPMMNLEEFLKTVTSSGAADDEEDDAGTGHSNNLITLRPPPLPSSSSSSIPPAFFVSNLNTNGTAASLRKKALDEVWKEIAHQREERFDDNLNQESSSAVVQKQLNLGGETATLEDFLVRAGLMNQQDVIASPPPPSVMDMDPMAAAAAAAAADWLQFQICSAEEQGQKMAVLDSHDHHHHQQQQQFHHASAIGSGFGNNGVMGDSAENQLVAQAMSMAAVAAATSSDSQASVEKKRRVSNEMMEKTMERRQKRMIKNRESAARSRAKKQVCLLPIIGPQFFCPFRFQKLKAYLLDRLEQAFN